MNDVPIIFYAAEREQIIKLMIYFINKIADKDDALGIINALENSQSKIGQSLLRVPTTDFFNTAVRTLSEFLKSKILQLGLVEELKEEKCEGIKIPR